MSIARFAVQRRVTVLMAVLVLIILGAVSYGRVPMDLFPDMSFPGAVVITSYEGAGPQEVETIVTRPIEEMMGTVTRVKRISSTSREALSLVVVQFDWGTDMDFAALDLREKVDRVKGYFPAEVSSPMVVKFDPSMMPIMMISMTAAGADARQDLRQLALDLVKPRLERVEGVAQVTVSGGSTSQVLISVDQSKLADAGIAWSQVAAALRGLNVNLPGGSVTEKGRDYLIRSIGEVKSLAEMENLIVGARARGRPPVMAPVYLKDIAAVRLTSAEETAVARLNGQSAVTLTIQKASTGNTVQVARRVQDALTALKQEMPAGTQLQATMNQADFIARAIDVVKTNAWQGALLAVAVLYLFLWNVRSVVVIGLAIPISVIATFNLLHFSQLTFNLMTLSGLVLGIGMLVDNSIVVLENIFRRMQDGEESGAAAVNGTTQVGLAISASTLTTVVVFLPVVFVGGISGMLFKELALTVTFSLLTSLVVAMTFVPMAASLLFRGGAAGGAGGADYRDGGSPVRAARRDALLLRGYAGLLRGALAVGPVVVLLAVLAFAASLTLVDKIGGEFIPHMDHGEFTVRVTMPPGTSLAETDKVVARVETAALAIPERVYVTATAGSAGLTMSRGGRGLTGGGDAGSVVVKLGPRASRTRSTDAVMADLRGRLQFVFLGEARLAMEQSGSLLNMGGIRPIEITVSGPDLEILRQLSVDVARLTGEVTGASDVETSLETGRPEIRLNYDREAVARSGLSPLMVGSMVRSAIQGERVASYLVGEREIDVVLRLRPEDRDRVAKLADLVVSSPAAAVSSSAAPSLGRAVRLGDLARIVEDTGPSVIQREAGRRTATITANLTGRDVSSAVSDIKAKVAGVWLPTGYAIEYGGEAREMAEAFAGLSLAFILSLILVYMVMAAQFESLLHSFIIMLTMPLAAIGVLGVLYQLKLPFSIPSVIGVIVLGGVVVNNAIVMVDFIVQLKKEGRPRGEAVVEGATLRLRPILMTTVTTLLGLIPMALAGGEGSELARPLAVTLIAGLATSTFLTLFVIPIVFTWIDRLAEAVGRVGRRTGTATRGGDGGAEGDPGRGGDGGGGG